MMQHKNETMQKFWRIGPPLEFDGIHKVKYQAFGSSQKILYAYAL